MAATTTNLAIWEEIELSESYLVCDMYEEAAALASSVLKRIRDNSLANEGVKGIELYDMMESTGMVLVQSLNQLGRASETLNELKVLFFSVVAIPVQVLLIGACFQISKGSSLGVQFFLEEFLSNWSYVDGEYHVLIGAEADLDAQKLFHGRYTLGVDKYMDIVELYAVTLLGRNLNDWDLAISWVEKSALPEEKRQGLLRRLHSLYSLKASDPSQGLVLPEHHHQAHYSSSNELNICEESRGLLKAGYLPKGKNDAKQAILKLSRCVDPCFYWFRSINLKFGNARVVITNGKIVLGCLILLICYIVKRKHATVNGIFKNRVLSLRKALVDLWQLAFSYQVNPLAAVQLLPTATRGSFQHL